MKITATCPYCQKQNITQPLKNGWQVITHCDHRVENYRANRHYYFSFGQTGDGKPTTGVKAEKTC